MTFGFLPALTEAYFLEWVPTLLFGQNSQKLHKNEENGTDRRTLPFIFFYYRPQLRKGNVFTSVCQEFCLGGVYPSMHWGRHPQGQTPTPWADTTRGRHPLGKIPPPNACWDTHLPAQCILGYTPLPRRPLQRTVRILLECILVFITVLVICLSCKTCLIWETS